MLLFFFIANSTSNSILNCQSCYCSGIVYFLLSTLLQFNVQRSKIMKNAYEFHPLLNPCQFFPVGLGVTCLSIVPLVFDCYVLTASCLGDGEDLLSCATQHTTEGTVLYTPCSNANWVLNIPPLSEVHNTPITINHGVANS